MRFPRNEINLWCFAHLPDGNRMERPISRLQPGGIATRSFPVFDATKWLGKRVRVGLYDPKGPKRINYEVEIN